MNVTGAVEQHVHRSDLLADGSDGRRLRHVQLQHADPGNVLQCLNVQVGGNDLGACIAEREHRCQSDSLSRSGDHYAFIGKVHGRFPLFLFSATGSP